MKKILTLVAVALFGFSTSFAQTATTVKQAPKKAATVVKTETKKAEKKATSTATKLKADGTPDMRYKENKAAKVVTAGPKKKDGTADMRYKVNKEAAKKKN
ncbi:hypothetical protein [Pedobacter nanyangensis]|uniref:hypothetical protein n=1 Tax=Pedobacter nanyangensis TaxID=1562389 RepID=UPI000DE4F9E0|nr:hypothetical protein [Pedobacter nanyangensis]